MVRTLIPLIFYSEVNVGRIPWSDSVTVTSICEKSVLYEQNNDESYKKNILLLGAYFWDDTDNAELMEAKVDQPWMYDWSMTRMYEQGHSTFPMDYDLKNNNVVSIWSSGKYGFVNWAGHGSPTASYILYSTGEAFIKSLDTANLNDNYPAIIFADACSNSDTDYLNIGQAMIKKGGVGFLGATKVAFGQGGWDSPYDGSGQSLDYFFTTYVTSGDYTQGQAHQTALREMYTNGLWYYLKYETFEWGALWGNPDLGMTTVIISDPLIFSNIKTTPQIKETNDWVNISCDVTATFGLNNVNVIITNPDLSTDNVAMTNLAGTDTYYHNTTYTNAGLYEFHIWAEDLNNDATTSSSFSFEIGIPPEISQEIANPNIQQNGNQVNLTCMVTDNDQVNTVTVNITDPSDVSNIYTMNTVGRSDEYFYDAVYTVDGVHGFYIEAVDNNDNIVYSAVHYFYIGDDGVSFDLDVNTGWNLMGLPVEYDMMSSELAASIEDCLSVNSWDAVNQTYRPYIVGGPPDFDFPVSPGIGLFVDAETIGGIIFVGPPALDVSIDLEIGWNLLGWYNVSSTMASSLAENISSCLSVNAWDGVNQTYKPYIVGGPPDFDFMVTPGMGLFVDVTIESTWTGEG